MHGVISHLARRGFEMTMSQPNNNGGSSKETYDIDLPKWGIAMLATTAVVFFIASAAIEYTFGRLIPTLLMVESPQALLYEPLDTIDPDAPINKNADPELVLVKQKPITSSFRATIKHLQAKAGFRARFRGIALYVVYSIVLSSVAKFIGVFLPFGLHIIAPIFATVLLANASLAWTHIVISDPSPKPWYRRLPERRMWKKVAGPTAMLAIAEQLAIVIPVALAGACGLGDINPGTAHDMAPGEARIVALKGFGLLALSAVLGLGLVIPANVTLTRVQASLLADDQESIVPFDRSFGGKVIPEIVGGSGVVSNLDAWKTFDWSARIRLIKAYVKVFFMQFALTMLFIGVAIAQIVLVIGKTSIIKKPNHDTDERFTYGG